MAIRRAKILSDAEIDALRVFAWNSRKPLRNDVMVLLSVKAGLRAKEIAALTWCMVLGAGGEVGAAIELSDAAVKGGRGRVVPTHPDLVVALHALVADVDTHGPVIASERGGPMLPVNVVHWFARAFRAIGIEGCSSHSGRRTFITRAARKVHLTGGSLRDVQILAGHQSIDMTQRYIDGDTDAQRRLVALI
ncbi:MAG: site-specific integrase [Rhizobiales bacterium]|nr:site-specific integrase [Hyphomicrobiales bacterium]